MSTKDPRNFFENGTPAQYDFALSLYNDALRLKAESKNKKPEELKKLDRWYQHDLPKTLSKRGKTESFVNYDELVQCIKWKLARGKFRPRLKELVQMNTPRVVLIETKKAFRCLFKKDDVNAAVQALCNLKGVGPAMASAILAAAAPDRIAFMADECLLAMPDNDGLDYTMKELMNFQEQIGGVANRLNETDPSKKWTPHKVELALWAHSVCAKSDPSLLDPMPSAGEKFIPPGGSSVVDEESCSSVSNALEKNGGSSNDVRYGEGEESMDSLLDEGSMNSSPSSSTALNKNGAYVEEDSNLSVGSAPGLEKADSSCSTSAQILEEVSCDGVSGGGEGSEAVIAVSEPNSREDSSGSREDHVSSSSGLKRSFNETHSEVQGNGTSTGEEHCEDIPSKRSRESPSTTVSEPAPTHHSATASAPSQAAQPTIIEGGQA
ncbi:unnamed protein product [Cyprideis torosa]|uniref:Uncharacterized protein n=1 Tax=Cyprideis torosa TaxID=163714 RepID=A0A7R8WFD9_9CRUS|nr:unnamed protein product [Cyprideis torosa]CAG0896876.1 unnamed protein product [Cyprideis torosa]